MTEIEELRTRVEALEATQHAAEVAPIVVPITRHRDEIGDYIIVHDTPSRAGSLVDRVMDVLGHHGDGTARAAILEVAEWLAQNGWGTASDALLRQEANR